jgi:hypothetical protein
VASKKEKPLKVFAGSGFIYTKGGNPQKEVCIAAPSRAAALRGLQSSGLLITAHELRDWWSETGNEKQIAVAISQPGVPFYAEMNGRQDWQPYNNKETNGSEENPAALDSEAAQDDAGRREGGEHGERAGEAARAGTEVQDGARAGRKLAEVSRPSKYGNMPTNPRLTATVRGDAGTYNVLGIDWRNHRVLLDRAGDEWLDIAKVAISDQQPQGD